MAAHCLTSLDPSETSVDHSVEMSGPQRRIHHRWIRVRDQIILALRHGSTEKLRRRGGRIDGCCYNPEFRRGSAGQPVLVHRVCRDRLCPRCQIQRGTQVATRIALLTHAFNAPRFLTLTLAHKGETLRAMTDRLYACFRKLRSTKMWKAKVVGGVYAAQVTRNTRDGEWHAHLHIIIDGEFWAQASIAKAWKAITGDSSIVDIRAVVDRRNVASYVAEYVSRPNEIVGWGWDAICEYAEAMHGRRMVHTFGTAHGIEVESEDDCGDALGGDFVSDSLTLLRTAKAGSFTAAFAVTTLASIGRDFARVLGVDHIANGAPPLKLSPDDVAQALSIARQLYLDPQGWREREAAMRRPKPLQQHPLLQVR